MSIGYGNKAVTPGTPTIYTIPTNIGWCVIQNESPYTLACSVDGTGSTRSIAAQTIDKIPVPSQGFNGNIVLMPQVILSNSSNAPSYEVILDAYGQNEEPTGSYPVALSRTVQVGGTVNALATTAAELKNDNNAAGTIIIEVTPADALSSTWSADNEGNLVIRTNNGGVLTEAFKIIAGVNPLLKIMAGPQFDSSGHIIMPNNITLQWYDASNVNQKVLVVNATNDTRLRAAAAGGNIVLADQNDTAIATFSSGGVIIPNNWPIEAKLTGGSTQAILLVDTSNETVLISATTGGAVIIGDAAGSNIATFNKTTGLTMAAGGVNFTTGSISKIAAFGPYTLSTTAAFFNHNLGVVPDFIILTRTGTSNSVETAGYEDTTMTTTQVKLVSNGSFTFRGLAIKF